MIMIDLPGAETYELQFKYMPWGQVIDRVASKVAELVKPDGTVVDLMSGTGLLLKKISLLRPDLTMVGIDIDPGYIEYANLHNRNENVSYCLRDVSEWQAERAYDCVLCTAGLHHLENVRHSDFLRKMSRAAVEGGVCICAEPCLGDVGLAPKSAKLLEAAKLGYEYLKVVIRNDAPLSVIQATIDIISNDMLGVQSGSSECKDSIAQLKHMAQVYFGDVEVEKVWPKNGREGYGDYILTMRE